MKEEIDYSKSHQYIDVYYNGKPFFGKAAFINGYNGYESSDTDGCLCAIISDRNGVPSCWNDDGEPNFITNKRGIPIRLKNRRGITTNLNGKLRISYEDRMSHGYYNKENTSEDYGFERYETGVFESKTKNKNNMNKKLIRLTEQDLHNIIKESVNNVLNEIGNTLKGQNALGQVNGRASVRSYYADGAAKEKYRKTARDARDKAYSESEKNKLFAGSGSAYDDGITAGQHKAEKKLDLHRIVKESVNRILREHTWGETPEQEDEIPQEQIVKQGKNYILKRQ